MAQSPKTVRSRIHMLQPLLKSCSIPTLRKGQDKLGELMESKYRTQVLTKEHGFSCFPGAWILPKDERRQGVILYLHGGGYTCGGLDYAKGFGTALAVRCGARVLCAAYRLAPENPYPAALDDALEAYRYLLEKGYRAEHITLCGESAGGGLCFSLCQKLRELELPQPGGILAISPWTDLTASGSSYQENRDKDVSMTSEVLSYFAGCYAGDLRDPYVSPLFGDLHGMPPTLIFTAAEEIMRSDSEDLHQKLLAAGCRSQLVVKPERWHGYVLYCLKEDQDDFDRINEFLNKHMCPEHKLRWMPLDNAAKIYPANRSQNWSNVFRLSATLKEDVDRDVLQSALDVTVRRFPSIATRLRRGVFWYYLQQVEHAPRIREEHSYPLTRMSKEETRQCAFRVIVYRNRIAVEMFHSLTDGNGALVFLKSLLAEYLQQKHGLRVPAEQGVLGRLEEPSAAELEDSFQRYAGSVKMSRKGNDAWRLQGTPEKDRYLNVTCFRMDTAQVLEKAKEMGITLTAYLCAAMMLALQNLQAEKVRNPARRKHIKVLIPVNLRKMLPSKTLRNFVLYTTPEIDPRLGGYSFREICKVVHHHMGLYITAKQMQTLIATNISSERLMAVKVMPLFIKNLVMKLVFLAVGERKSCLSLSNLGAVKLPDIMMDYVERLDFILGVQATGPYNCGVVSLGDTLYLNLIRNIQESELEYHFFKVLQELGISVTVESNRREE